MTVGSPSFSAPITRPLSKLPSTINCDTKNSQEGEFPLAFFYIHESVFIVEHSVLQKALTFFNSPDCSKNCLHISQCKSSIWWPYAPYTTAQVQYPQSTTQCYSDGTVLLQSPMAMNPCFMNYLNSHVQELSALMKTTAELECAHIAFRQLRLFANICRRIYLLRTVPPISALKIHGHSTTIS